MTADRKGRNFLIMTEEHTLNKQQKAAATLPLAESRYQIIEAIAGSGKTTTAAARIDYLIENENIDPKRIIAITFTRSGGESLKRKIAHSIGFSGTLHGLAMRSLNIKADDILTEEEEQEYTREVMRNTGLKMSLKDATRILNDPKKHHGNKGVFSRVYTNGLLRRGAWTHAEILRKFLINLETVSAGKGLGIDILIVDEAQDTSAMDAAIYSAMHPRLLTLAIGDENQAIYQFRGATGLWMDKIRMLSSDEGRTPLSMSYRFGNEIAQRAQKIGQSTVTGNPRKQSDFRNLTFENERDEETDLIAWSKRFAYSGCAILTRYNADVSRIRKALSSAGVKVQPGISLSFQLKSDSAIIAAVARILIDPDSVDSFDEMTAFPDSMVQQLKERWGNYQKLKKAILINSVLSELVVLFRLFMVPSELLEHDVFRNSYKTAAELCADIANNETGNRADDSTGVFVETIHASKGREWNSVAVSGLDSRLDIPGGRNLAYVAITRAKERAFVTRCETIVSQFTGKNEKTEPFSVLFG